MAVLRHQHAAIAALLEGGLPADVKNERRWNPVDEAVALGDAAATKLLYRWRPLPSLQAAWGLAADEKGALGSGRRRASCQQITAALSCRFARPLANRRPTRHASLLRCPRSHLLAAAKVAKRQKKAQLVAIMESLPDFRMQASAAQGCPRGGCASFLFLP